MMFLFLPQQRRLVIKVGVVTAEAFRQVHLRRGGAVTWPAPSKALWVWSLSLLFCRLRQWFSLRWVRAPFSPPIRPSVQEPWSQVGIFHWFIPQVGEKYHPRGQPVKISILVNLTKLIKFMDLKKFCFSLSAVFPFRLRVSENWWPDLRCGPVPHGHRSHRQ